MGVADAEYVKVRRETREKRKSKWMTMRSATTRGEMARMVWKEEKKNGKGKGMEEKKKNRRKTIGEQAEVALKERGCSRGPCS
jgi:hypothetical protein